MIPVSLTPLVVGLENLRASPIVSQRFLQHIRPLTNRLPFGVAESAFGFEHGLADLIECSDLSVCVKPELQEDTPDWISALFVPQGDRVKGSCHPSMLGLIVEANTARALECWLKRTAFQAISELWLEFDMSLLRAPSGTPNIFLGRGNTRQGLADLSPFLDDITAICRTIWPRSNRSASILSEVERITELTGCADSLFAVGLMLARDGQPCRVHFKNVTEAVLLNQFCKIRPFAASTAAEALQAARDLLQLFLVSVPLESTTNAVGIELYADPNLDDCATIAHWQRLFQHLERVGVAVPDVSRAAISFVGRERVHADDFAQTAELRLLAAIQPEKTHLYVQRSIHHVKLILNSSGMQSAKVYVSVRHVVCPAN